MIALLSSFFIPDRENRTDPDVRRRYGVLCGAVGIVLNIILFIAKFIAGLLSSSIAITADAVNNLSDAGSSLVTLIGFKLAGQAPDPDHPFGHGRFEYISGLVVAFLILMMGIELLKSSVDKILHPAPIEGGIIVVGILIVSICVKLYMYSYNRAIGKKIDSAAMKATAMDSLSDTVATSAVLVATIVGTVTDWMIDGWIGIVVAMFILYSGVQAAKETISPLLGQPPEREFVEQIERIVLSYEQIRGIHDLVVHNYGPGRLMISLHAEVPAHGDILALHDMIDNVEQQLRQELKCDAVIHMDPVVTDDPQVNTLKQLVLDKMKEISSCLSLHDFRIVAGPTHTNVLFDIVVPYDCCVSGAEAHRCLKEFVEGLDGHQYNAIIQVDRPYVDEH